jgi:hypothetical protein
MTELQPHAARADSPHRPIAQTLSPAEAGRAPLAERLVRALCVVGLVISSASILELLAAPLLMGQNPFQSYFRTRQVVFMLLMVRFALGVTSSVVLLAGSVGELRRKDWGRVLLSLYVWLWVAGAVASLAAMYAFRADYAGVLGPAEHRRLVLVSMLQHVGYVLGNSAYPLLLTVCLRWPEGRRTTSDSRGFRPVLPIGPEGDGRHI